MIYAYGSPRNGSMNVIAHTSSLAPDGSVQPSRIDTGSAGLVNGRVSEVGGPRDAADLRPRGLLVVLAIAGGSLLLLGLRRRPGAPRRTAAG